MGGFADGCVSGLVEVSVYTKGYFCTASVVGVAVVSLDVVECTFYWDVVVACVVG